MSFARYKTPLRVGLVIYWAALFIGTHVPQLPSGVEEVSDKLLHYLAYAGLAFLLAADRDARGAFSLRNGCWLAVILAVYAAVDELLQIPVGRTADIRDWGADVIGVVCGMGLYALLAWGIRSLSSHTR